MLKTFEYTLRGTDMMTAAAIMASFIKLDTKAGDKALLGPDIAENNGYDAILGGYLRLSLFCADVLNAKIESYDDGVFTYDRLETGDYDDQNDMALPAVLLRELSVEQWYQLIANWQAPDDLEQIIDAWLRDPRVAPGITLKSEPFEAL